jgi:hypothetical protein
VIDHPHPHRLRRPGAGWDHGLVPFLEVVVPQLVLGGTDLLRLAPGPHARLRRLRLVVVGRPIHG